MLIYLCRKSKKTAPCLSHGECLNVVPTYSCGVTPVESVRTARGEGVPTAVRFRRIPANSMISRTIRFQLSPTGHPKLREWAQFTPKRKSAPQCVALFRYSAPCLRRQKHPLGCGDPKGNRTGCQHGVIVILADAERHIDTLARAILELCYIPPPMVLGERSNCFLRRQLHSSHYSLSCPELPMPLRPLPACLSRPRSP